MGLGQLRDVLTRPIRWKLIAQQYDQMVKYATALRREIHGGLQVVEQWKSGKDLRSRGAEIVGELKCYEHSCRLCYVWRRRVCRARSGTGREAVPCAHL